MRHTLSAACKDQATITSLAIERLHEMFKAQADHMPSRSQLDALYDVIGTLATMAVGPVERKVYLSSLDPGVGKSTAICAFVSSLVSLCSYGSTGVIICLSRLDEIRTLIDRMELPSGVYGVLTSDDELNALGVGANHVGDAQVLFTTQQRIENRLNGRDFEGCKEFQYLGVPRSVRIWDESWLPGYPVGIGRDELAALFQPIRPVHPKLAQALEAVFHRMREQKDGTQIKLPAFDVIAGAPMAEMTSLVTAESAAPTVPFSKLRNTVENLWRLSGKSATVRVDGQYGPTLVGYRETLPADLLPLVVTDASARVRETYAVMEQYRDCVRRLRTAAKRYSNLNVYVWSRSGSKSGWRREGRTLADGIASTANGKLDEEWLIVVHKPDKVIGDIQRRVRALLKGDPDRVKFLTWGNHAATNAYSHIQNVILAGTLFNRPSYYEALGMLAASHSAEDGLYSGVRAKQIEVGESRHMILQAACRGSVRRSHDGTCAPCSLYVIASSRSQIRSELDAVFPGCQVHPWTPHKKAINGKVKEAVNYVQSRLEAGETYISFSATRSAIGISDASNFHSDVRKHPDFKAEIARLNLIEWGSRSRITGLRVNHATFYGFERSESEW